MLKISVLLLTTLCVVSSCQNYSSGLQQSVVRADETSATAALHTIAAAQRTYSTSNEGEFATFPKLAEGGYVDERFAATQPTVKDYMFTMEVRPKSADGLGFYSCNADPLPTGKKVGNHFYIDSTSSGLHVNPDRPASATDPLVQP